MKIIQEIRRKRYIAQNGKCYYCQQPMWCEDPASFAEAHQLSLKRALFLQATAEHLQAKCEGGGNSFANIVAACHFCNSRRHLAKSALPPESYLKKVRRRMSIGKWHGIRLGRIAPDTHG